MADYTLAPAPYQTVLDTAGAPVPNACIWTYTAGTTTPAATYSDALGTVNTNPIRADSAGRFTAYLTPGAGYKFVVETPCSPPSGHGSVIRTADNIVGVPATAAVTSGTWIPTLGGTATYSVQEGTWARIGPLVFARGTLAVQILGTGSGQFVSGLPFAPTNDAAGVVSGAVQPAAGPYTHATVFVPGGGTTFGISGMAALGDTATYLTFFKNGTRATFAVTYLTAAP